MSDKMREEFEAWHGKMIAQHVINARTIQAFTLEVNKEAMFEIWRASRESLVVDLSGCEEDLHDGGAYYSQCRVDEAIEAAGLKVKP